MCVGGLFTCMIVYHMHALPAADQGLYYYLDVVSQACDSTPGKQRQKDQELSRPVWAILYLNKHECVLGLGEISGDIELSGRLPDSVRITAPTQHQSLNHGEKS